MDDSKLGPFEPVIEGPIEGIWSVTEDSEGNLYSICQSGYIYSVVDRQCQEMYNTGGQPTSLIYDNQNTGYICDMAHQRILCQTEGEGGRLEVTEIVKDYEGKSLLGPNTLAYNEENNYIYFTDSGQIGESNSGSIFAADLELLVLKPIALNCLAHPWGIVVSPDCKNIFVAETMKNRVLRITQRPHGVHHISVFYQFSGRLGPSALAISENGMLFVARYDYQENSAHGIVSVLDSNGNLSYSFNLQDGSEITGLYFSKISPNILYITERSSNMCYRVTVPSDSL